MKILIVEDEISVKDFLVSSFKRDGFQVAEAETLDDLESFVTCATSAPDVVMLDRLLGDKDSLSFIGPLRAAFPDTAIVVLSAINTSVEKANALDAGADDYVAKPFSIVELSARVRALLRRGQRAPASQFLKIGDMLLDNHLRHVTVAGQKIELAPKEFQLLYLLALNPTRIWGKYQILEKVWDSAYDIQSNVVEVTMRALRLKLEAGGSKAQIMNRRNIGYWLET